MNKTQKEKLKRLMMHLNKYNEFYRQLFEECHIDWSQDIYEEFLKLPIIEKETLRNNIDIYYSETNEELSIEKTSGSVGVPLLCKKSKTERLIAAYNVWEKRRKIDPEVTHDNYIHLFGKSKRLIGDFADLNEDNLVRLFGNITIKKYRWISGPISTILELARLIDRGVIENTCVKYIELFGEYSEKEQRAYIEDMFGCKTVVHYGTRETWCIAYECKCGNLHVQDDLFWVEIKANSELGMDENGEIVVTSLYNKVMPFVRYNLKDIGKLKNNECGCGSTSPCIELAGGRVADVIYGRNILGNNFFNRAMSQVFAAGYDCINKFKVLQIGLDHFEIHIVKAPNYSMEVEDILRRTIRDRLNADVAIDFIYVDALQPLPSGKFQNFECKIKK